MFSDLSSTFIAITLIAFAIFSIRFTYALFALKNRSYAFSRKKVKLKLTLVIGSGGHTTEILRILRHLKPDRFTPRTYILASSDTTSMNKIVELENSFANQGEYKIIAIPRSRKVHQSYVTSIFTTLYSIVYCVPLVLKDAPDVILCNGPGTCIPICVVAFVSRVLCMSETVIVFVESICRVRSLSLTGKILIYFADEIIVQWPELRRLYSRVKYVGDLKLL